MFIGAYFVPLFDMGVLDKKTLNAFLLIHIRFVGFFV